MHSLHTDYNRPEDSHNTTVQMCPAQNTVASSFYAKIHTVPSHATRTICAVASCATTEMQNTY